MPPLGDELLCGSSPESDERLVLVDDTHHWLKFSDVLKVGNATAGFFRRKLIRQQQTGKR